MEGPDQGWEGSGPSGSDRGGATGTPRTLPHPPRPAVHRFSAPRPHGPASRSRPDRAAQESVGTTHPGDLSRLLAFPSTGDQLNLAVPDPTSAVYPGGMTAGGKTQPYVPPPNGGPYGPPPGPGPSGYGGPLAPPPVLQPPRPRRLRTGLAAAGIVLAVVLAASALVVALTTRSSSSDSNSAAPAAGDPAASSSPASTEQADRALCTAIGPLMSDFNEVSNGWISLGAPGSPGRDAGLPKFKTDTEDFVGRAEAVMSEHPGVQPRLERTTQRYLDDLWLFVNNIVPGPSEDYDRAAWVDSLVAYGGPQSICDALGAGW